MIATKSRGRVEVTNALAELGLELEDLTVAIERGEVARDSCSDNDPPSAPGFDAWAKSVRALRDRLIPRKWTRNDDGNFSTVVSPDGKLAIAVATGDEQTGQTEGEPPQTKHARGPSAGAAINLNQYLLFREKGTTVADQLAEKKKRITWILLKRRFKSTVFAELSLPASMIENEPVKDWLRRIILEPILIESSVIVETDTQQVDVSVRRRS